MANKKRADREEMKINMRLIKNVELNVKKCDTIFDVKNKLEHLSGVEAKLQQMFLSGTFLWNDTQLSKYNVADGSTIDVHVNKGREMKIYVEMPMGKTIPLGVKEVSTVRRIMEMVHDTTRIPPERQSLIHRGTTLDDTHTLSACSIAAESTVHLAVKERDGMEMLISFPDGEVALFTVRKWYTVWDVKTVIKSCYSVTQEKQKLAYDGKQLEDRLTLAECKLRFRPTLELSYATQIPRMQIQESHISKEDKKRADREEMKINLKLIKTLELNVKRYHMISDVKNKLEHLSGVEAKLQQMFLSGTFLWNDTLLSKYNVADGSTIDVHVNKGREMKIYVDMPMGKTIPLGVKEGDTVRRIMEMVHDMTHIHPERQSLIYQGMTLDDTLTLSACSIAAESTVHLAVKERVDGMEMLISFPDGEVASFTVRTWYTVWDVKTVIKSCYSVTKEKQKLAYDGKLLEDWLTLAECKLRFRPTLELSYATQIIRRMQIQVKTFAGKWLTIYVHSCDRVCLLKKRIEEEEGVPCDQQRLIFAGKQMEDGRSLVDYDVSEGSTVDLVSRMRGS